MTSLVEVLTRLERWAVVGVSNDHAKFGRRVFEHLRAAGYVVSAVNPRLAELDDGTPVYPALDAVPFQVQVVNLVIPPSAAPPVLEASAKLGVAGIWFQPGAADREALALADTLGLKVVAGGPCALLEAHGPRPNG